MNRAPKTGILLTAPAVAAIACAIWAPAKDGLCFGSGGASYRLADAASAADFRISVAPDAAAPDLRIQPVDRPEIADLVLIDDPAAGGSMGCPASLPVWTVALHGGGAGAQPSDVTVRLSADGAADYRIYVRSARFSQREAAALLAAIWKADHRIELTGSIR